jgi:hypothetical protein
MFICDFLDVFYQERHVAGGTSCVAAQSGAQQDASKMLRARQFDNTPHLGAPLR